ncbi:MAG: hypothetical protein COA88_02955 [Kordia sp.]|nr:MAG: hypothetical protein COA88_02955 [Kordia sp.]
MRIVHLSDIHLSFDNHHEFIHSHRKALIKDLIEYHSTKNIDIILITGDLVDKGGHSLLEIKNYKEAGITNPYDIFQTIFIEPIIKEVGISKNQFLFIPGNHDINEKEISYFEECEMVNKINKRNISEYLERNNIDFINNKRIKLYKEFEKKFHGNNTLYKFSNNQSTFIYNYKESHKVGFILTNDSWRCKSRKLKDESEKLFFGFQQLDYSLEELENHDTDINICLLHHSLDDYEEKYEVERILNTKDIEIFLYGHYHSSKFEAKNNPTGNSIGIRGRAILNKPEEPIEEYQSGYQIIDLDLISYKINRIYYRKYIHKRSEFDLDSSAARRGIAEDKDYLNLHRNGQQKSDGKVKKGFDLDKSKFK